MPEIGFEELVALPPVAENRSMAARRQIERLITSGELAPGDRLAEVQLSARLGVSRGPIREAITALERDGLIEQIPNRGAFVRVVSEVEARGLYEIRSALFGLACELAARRSGGAAAIEFRALLASMRTVAERDDAAAYYELNREFHRALLTASGNPRLGEEYESISREINLFRARALSIHENIESSLGEHEEIAAAVVEGRASDARDLATRHVANGFERHLKESGGAR
ncbi:FCD domain-containing protein [Herbiconiux moechotypicola]|uniref:GntR family transcriptional regulator n=1 Tax=Herbiconiux moechotypicola TaxID=637393 RepID=A0ABP5QG79_9MICO|nr:FCD domain-containing protein [Herbiconiux moechotypicola]MCS5730085.1 FCD domain-containing protein [Herbiconiux moechotypicola]